MTTDIETIGENMTMIEARMLMRTQNATKMFVTNGDILVGFVTLVDMAIAFLKLMNRAK
jgi:CBS domain-containing protein